MQKLSILHCMRAPLGGLFRHVCDLAEGQTARGHRVGIVCDSRAASPLAEARLEALSKTLAMGVHRIDIPRLPGPGDLLGVMRTGAVAAKTRPDVLHGHGAKGGAYTRLLTRQKGSSGALPIRVYTPHGGSLHYSASSPVGRVFLGLEKFLMRRSELMLFESDYSRRTYEDKVGKADTMVNVVHNGVGEADLEPAIAADHADDILYIGELRMLKGIDVLIRAMAICANKGRKLRATIVGSGPDADRFKELAKETGLADSIAFTGAMPAREAFSLGRIAVVPSRNESLPYIVLELAGAAIPMIATDVGGISEIFGDQSGRLIAPDNAEMLAERLIEMLDDPIGAADEAQILRERVSRQFSVDVMVEAVLQAYQSAGAGAKSAAD